MNSGSFRAPLLWLLLPFGAGLVLADRWPAAAGTWGLLCGLAVLLVATAFAASRRDGHVAISVTGAALLGALMLAGYLWLPLRSEPAVEWTHPSREVYVVLAVEQLFPPAPHRRTFSGLGRIVEADGPARPLVGQRVYFAAIRRISRVPEISGHYRFRALVESVPRPAPGTRGFERYLESLGIRVRLMRGHLSDEVHAPTWFRVFCSRAQDRMEAVLKRGLERHPQVSSVYTAMLLGEKALLTPEQESAFMRTGVFHIFSISGLHVGVIAMGILSALVLFRVPSRWARLLSLFVLALYVQITGGSTPAERAFLMIAFLVASKVVHLPGNPLAALAGAALATLLWDPRQLFSTGFQMSYSVVLALVVVGLPLSERWIAAWHPWRDRPDPEWRQWHYFVRWIGRGFLSSVAFTWAATLASAPSSIGNFGLLSPGAILANLVVVPLATGAIVAGLISLLFGLVGLGIVSVLFNHAAAVLIIAMDWLVQRGTSVPGMAFPAEFIASWMTGAALVIVLGSMLLAANRRLGRAAIGWLPPTSLALIIIFGVKFP